jgi:hypothetical protein
MSEFLDLIEDHMIIVEALPEEGRREKKRMRTPKLKDKLKRLYEKCRNSRDFAIKPWHIERPSRTDSGALAPLNENARDLRHTRRAPLAVHSGRTRSHHQYTENDETATGVTYGA